MNAMAQYSEFTDRILRSSGLLGKLFPKDISDRELWRLVRDSTSFDDPTIAVPVVRGGLLYALDDLAGCHEFFQDTASDVVSYWHGMMHRREADFDNARYWFRRSGTLPFFDTLHHRAALISAEAARQSSWDPYLFTGECEQHRFGADSDVAELVRLQRAVFDVVFDYCWRQAKRGISGS